MAEYTLEQKQLFFGGFFDTGSGMNIPSVVRSRKLASGERSQYISVYPAIQYSDSDPIKVYSLKELYTGVFTPANGADSYRWMVVRRKALRVAHLIDGYALSRSYMISLFKEIENASCVEEKVSVRNRLLRINPNLRGQHLSEYDYYDLIASPFFIAGICRSRGIDLTDKFAINSLNIPLLEALKSYIGEGKLGIENGESITPENRDTAFGKGATLLLSKTARKELLKSIAGYCIV